MLDICRMYHPLVVLQKNYVAIGAAVSAKAQAFGPPVLLLAGDFWRNIGRVGQNTMVC